MAQASLVIQFILVILLSAVWMSDTQGLKWKWERKDTLIIDAPSTKAENVLFVGVSLHTLEDLYRAKFRSQYNVTFVSCKHLDTKENSFSFNCQVLYTHNSADLTREKRQIHGPHPDFSGFNSAVGQAITELLNKAKSNKNDFFYILNKAIVNNKTNAPLELEEETTMLRNSSLDQLHKEYNQSKLDGPVIVNITSSNATVSIIHPITHPVKGTFTSTTDSSTIPVTEETSFSPSTEETSMSTGAADNSTFPREDEISSRPSAGSTHESTRESTASITTTDQSSSDTTLTESVDLCSKKKHNCAENANCIPTNDSFSCTCLQGFTGNGTHCTDMDECSSSKPCHEKAGCINTAGSFTCACIKGYTGNGTHCVVAGIRQMERDSTITVEGLTTPLSKALFIGASIIEMESYYKRTIEQGGFSVVSTSCKHISIVGNDYTFKCLANYMPQIQTNRNRRQAQELLNLTIIGSEIVGKIKTIMNQAITNSTIYNQLIEQYVSGTTVNTQAELHVVLQYSLLSSDNFNATYLNITVTSDKPVYRFIEQPVPIQTTLLTHICEPGYGGDECDELEMNSPLVIGLISAASLLLFIVLGLGICLWRRCAVREEKADLNNVSDTERMEQPIAYTNLHFLSDSYVKIPRPRYVPGAFKPTFEVEDDLH